MKKTLFFSIQLLALIGASQVTPTPETGLVPFGPKPAIIEPTKTAFVRLDKVLSKEHPDQACHEWRDSIKRMSEYFSNEVAKLQSEDAKLQEMAANYKKGEKYMEPDALTKKKREITDLDAKLNRDKEDLQQSIMSQQQNLLMKMQQKIEKLAQDFFIKKQGWDAVFVAGALAISERVDVTDEMIALLNKEYDAQKAKETTASKPAIAAKAQETKPAAKKP